MTGGAFRAALMAVAGLCLAMAALALSVPSAAAADAPHAYHHGRTADLPSPATPDSAPAHETACCTVVACSMTMHLGLPVAALSVPAPPACIAEPVPAGPARHGLDRPPPLPPPRIAV